VGRPLSRTHIVALDGLRAIAVIPVIFAHANLIFDGPFPSDGISSLFAAIFGSGWIGVDLFFVLSGFLITGILLDSRDSQNRLRNFYARRFLRILPVYYLYLLILGFFVWFLPGFLADIPRFYHFGLSSVVFYFYNFRVAFVTQKPLHGLHHFWSLCIEEHFYLIWPFLVFRLSHKTLLRLCLIGMLCSFALRIAVIASGAWVQVAYLITPCRLDGLLAGAFIALAIRDEQLWARVRQWAPTAMLASGVTVLGIFIAAGHFTDFVDFRKIQGPRMDSSLILTLGIAALAVFFGGLLTLVLSLAPGNRFRRFLESRALVEIGKISYGIYVFHILVQSVIHRTIDRYAPQVNDWPSWLSKSLLVLSVSIGSFVVAFISYNLIEKRFLKMKKRFESVNS
jgi:peptidoglycan/LPS O-acetylase OafA/YrhL